MLSCLLLFWPTDRPPPSFFASSTKTSRSDLSLHFQGTFVTSHLPHRLLRRTRGLLKSLTTVASKTHDHCILNHRFLSKYHLQAFQEPYRCLFSTLTSKEVWFLSHFQSSTSLLAELLLH